MPDHLHVGSTGEDDPPVLAAHLLLEHDSYVDVEHAENVARHRAEHDDDTARCLTCGLAVGRDDDGEWIHENGSRFCSINGEPGESLAWPDADVELEHAVTIRTERFTDRPDDFVVVCSVCGPLSCHFERSGAEARADEHRITVR